MGMMSYQSLFGSEHPTRESFPFETGNVSLPDGRVFMPKRDSLARWYVERPIPYMKRESTYEILYQLEGNRFVVVDFDDSRYGDCRPYARRLSKNEALSWLLEANFSLPEALESKVRLAAGPSGLSALLRNPGIVERVRRLIPTFEPDRMEDVAILRDCLAHLFHVAKESVTKLTAEQVAKMLDHRIEVELGTPGRKGVAANENVEDELHCRTASAPGSDGRNEPLRAAERVVEADEFSAEISQGLRVDIGDPGMPCRVNGHTKDPLTDAQRAIVAALLEASDEGLTKDGLEAVRSGARQTLRTLMKDSDWYEIILMPGQTNGRYRIRT